ncbi:MAG TPA: type II toxin-antitoxin system VapC family toxin [Devosia sp.]|nr:type II toxin-antitoxin system VapC family toxin [Devosia sp.]
MRLLLDTHVLLWGLADPRRLSREVARLIENERNEVYVSVASLFEIAARNAGARRRGLAVSAGMAHEASLRAGYRVLPILPEHAIGAEGIAPFHGDPFDRLLLAQANVEGLQLVTHDEALAAYDPRTILF